jgi:heme oxygenase
MYTLTWYTEYNTDAVGAEIFRKVGIGLYRIQFHLSRPKYFLWKSGTFIRLMRLGLNGVLIFKKSSMISSTNRFLLRELTREHHQQLDSQVGALEDRQSYIRYICGMTAFRETIEPQLRRLSYPIEFGGWRPTLIQAELEDDMRDLGLAKTAAGTGFEMAPDISHLMGALYVIEGSTLGARVLVRQAQALGMNGTFGARHLAAQTSNPESWIAFQQILQEIEPFDVELAAKSACDTFEVAYHSFRKTRHAEFNG